MNSEMLEFFGEPISVYTEEEALEDGVLMQNPSKEFTECNLITSNLWGALEGLSKATALTKPIDLLNIVMQKAREIYRRGAFKGDHDSNFFTLPAIGDMESVWFVRNGNNLLTAMIPSDY